MATVRYTVINGQIIAEKRDGVRKFYSSDALGSTVALYSGSTKTDTFSYWPYGETRTSSGSTPTKYKFVGTLGCREQADGGIYMRARVEDPEDGRWMTVDPLWPIESSYGYAFSSPATFADNVGLLPWKDKPPTRENCQYYLDECRRGSVYACNAWRLCLATGDSSAANCVRGCLLCAAREHGLRRPSSSCWGLYLDHLACMNACGYGNQCFNAGSWDRFKDMCTGIFKPGSLDAIVMAQCGYDRLPPLPKGCPPRGATGPPLGVPPPFPTPPPGSLFFKWAVLIKHKVCGHSVDVIID